MSEMPGRDEDRDLEWEEVSCEHIVTDKWIDIRRSAFRFPDGSVFEPFYSYSRRDYVVIVATDTDGKYICVRQYRQGIKRVTTEFPAGGIERTDGKQYGGEEDAEAAEDAAKRELAEETGYESDCRKAGGQSLDETEFLNVKKYSSDEIDAMIKEGSFPQAMHVMAYLMSKSDK